MVRAVHPFLRSPDVSPNARRKLLHDGRELAQAAAPVRVRMGRNLPAMPMLTIMVYVHPQVRQESKNIDHQPNAMVLSVNGVRGDLQYYTPVCSLVPCNTRPFFARKNAVCDACTICGQY